MPADTPKEAPMTDPIKLAREALRAEHEDTCALYCGEDYCNCVYAEVRRTSLAALDAIPQPAPVPADAELDALQERLVNPRQWSLKGDARRAADALSALRTRLAEVEGVMGRLAGAGVLAGLQLERMGADGLSSGLIDALAAHRKLREGK